MFDPTAMALSAVLKINDIHSGVRELQQKYNDDKQRNFYLEVGLASVATLGVLLGLIALWQTARLHRRLLEHTARKETDVHH